MSKYGSLSFYFLRSVLLELYSLTLFEKAGGHYLLIAGAMPPTDPGPGMFPATAAA